MITRIDYGTGSEALERQRAETRDVCEIAPLGPIAAFGATAEVARVGSTVMIRTSTSAVAYTRSEVHIARGGYDHFQIQLQLEGSCRNHARTLLPGDIGVHDMNRPSVTELRPAARAERLHMLVWLVPRWSLAPFIDVDETPQLRLIASAPYTKLLDEQLALLWQHGPHCTPDEGQTIAHAAMMVLAGGLGRAQPAASPSAPQRAAIKTYIERELASPRLSVDAVARAFEVSRASLYRLLEPDGGFASYVRGRRLQRAARTLTSPAHRHLRILDIALDSHFANETSFSRAFRRLFGITPAELRASTDAHGVVRTRAGDPLRWLRELGIATR